MINPAVIKLTSQNEAFVPVLVSAGLPGFPGLFGFVGIPVPLSKPSAVNRQSTSPKRLAKSFPKS